jgi:hypothetical protein
MSKRSKRSRRVPADRSATVDVVTQLGIAIRNLHAALIGAVLGGLVPWFGRTLAVPPAAWKSTCALVGPVRWRRATLGDVSDAEIVSETLLS